MTNAKRNGNIEFLRITFSIAVVLYHASGRFNDGNRILSGGYLAVEFFFMLSGVFLGRHLRPQYAEAKCETIEQTISAAWQYLRRRWNAIYPLFFISTLVGLCVNLFAGTWSSFSFGALIRRLPAEFLILQNYGFSVLSATGTLWYLCAMFFSLWLLYPIARRYYAFFVKYLAPVFGLAVSGLLVSKFQTLNVPNSYLEGVFNTGFMRAFAMMSLGLVINEICAMCAERPISRVKKLLLSVAEPMLYFIFVWYMMVPTNDRGTTDGSAVIVLFFAVLITCSEKSIWHGRFNHPVVLFLGRFSVALYLNHYYWCLTFNSLCRMYNLTFDTNEKIVCVIALSSVSAFLVYGIERTLRLCIKKSQSISK